MNRIVEAVGDAYKKAQTPEFDIGDTVDVHVRIKEGDRERIQLFTGTVIGKKGRGANASFTVRHIFQGEGVERIFPLHCPSVEKVEVKRQGKVRRAKLYFLRERSGRGTRLAERRMGAPGEGLGAAAEAPAPPAESAGPAEKPEQA
jgi:large subunit ribosomal protein L19